MKICSLLAELHIKSLDPCDYFSAQRKAASLISCLITLHSILINAQCWSEVIVPLFYVAFGSVVRPQIDIQAEIK